MQEEKLYYGVPSKFDLHIMAMDNFIAKEFLEYRDALWLQHKCEWEEKRKTNEPTTKTND